jgi:rod shape-determining protein MreC
VRNFLLLIRRFWNLILFITLEMISFLFIAKSRNVKGLDLINSSNSFVGYFYKKQNDIIYYFQLKRLNDSLLLENKQLNERLSGKTYVDTFQDAIARIPVLQYDSSRAPNIARHEPAGDSIMPAGPAKIIRYASYKYIPARVIKNSVSNDRINFITLNRGSEAGIKKGMAVVTGNGIVGRVEYVSKHYASVASVLSDRKTSARLTDGTFGSVLWEPGTPEYVLMDKVALTLPVKKGDSVFTTGYSYYPENILIGVIQNIDTLRASNTKNLRIHLSTNFRKLQYVYVVSDEMGKERESLDAPHKTDQQ